MLDDLPLFDIEPSETLDARSKEWAARRTIWEAASTRPLRAVRDNAIAAPLVLRAPKKQGAATVAPEPSRAPASGARAPAVSLSLFVPEKAKVEPAKARSTQAAVSLVTPSAPRFTVTPAPRLRRDYENPFLRQCAEKIARGPLTFDERDWDHNARGAVGVDVECFVNFFCVCFKRFSDGRRLAFRHGFDADVVAKIIAQNTLVSFHGTTYDLPMIYLAMRGASEADLKAASDRIIKENIKPWDAGKTLGVTVPKLNHIDLMEPNPSVRMGLKMLYARLHGRYLVDLPFDPDAYLSAEQMDVAVLYCHNDLDATETLYRALREPLELRSALGKTYGADFRSRSDAQIGEAIVKQRVEAETGKRLPRTSPTESSFGYDVPDFIEFAGSDLRGVLDSLRSEKFTVVNDKIVPPMFLKELQVHVGEMSYSMGIGGLHSTEAHRAMVSDEERFLLDVDVASQYPAIIMKLGLYPRAMGPAFLGVYDRIIRERLEAKATGDKTKADGGKIMVNGVFGKLGSPYSPLYAPHLMIAVTLTGQLAVLMLIERAEIAGIPVVSANTDGVIFHCPRGLGENLDAILAAWEADTGFEIERTPYRALYSSSVNTYVAVREDGKVKRKGAIADPWSDGDLRGQMSKNPQMTICSEAIVRYLADGAPMEETVRRCVDPRMFVTVIRVATGGVWRGHKLGRVVRYYWSTDGEAISYADGVRKVAKTDGARPMPEMTGTVPPDLDRARYVAEATKIAAELGIPEFQREGTLR